MLETWTLHTQQLCSVLGAPAAAAVAADQTARPTRPPHSTLCSGAAQRLAKAQLRPSGPPGLGHPSQAPAEATTAARGLEPNWQRYHTLAKLWTQYPRQSPSEDSPGWAGNSGSARSFRSRLAGVAVGLASAAVVSKQRNQVTKKRPAELTPSQSLMHAQEGPLTY